MRKIVGLLITVFTLTVVLAFGTYASQPVIAGGPWYVSTSGNDTNNCLTPSTACLTIQAAINKAAAGDTINVAAGTYSQALTINKAGLTLQGVGYPKITKRASPVVLLAASGITIRGFEIYDTIQSTGGFTGNTLVSDSGWGPSPSLSGFTIVDCKFHDSDYGISTQSVVGNVAVRNSEFYNLKRDGVHLSSDNLNPGPGISMTVDIHDNWFHNYWYDTSFPKNSKDTASVGMDNGNGWISGNVYSNYISGMKLGLRVYYQAPTSSQIAFSHNTIDQIHQPTGSPVPYGTMGFSFWGVEANANNIILRDNIIANAGWYGIYQESDDHAIQGSFQIINNVFYNNYKYSVPYAANHYPFEWMGTDVIAQAGWLEGPQAGFTFTNDITAQDPKFAYTDPTKPDQNWALTCGSSAYRAASDGTNVGAWQGTLQCDSIPPTTTAQVTSGTSGNNGWYTSSSVAVTLTATDNPGGSGVKSVTYSLDAGVPVTTFASTVIVTMTGDGTHSLSYYAIDNVGNQENPPNSLTVKIDSTLPIVTGSASRVPDHNGWYNHPVTITFTGTDATSGIDLSTCTSVSYSSPDSQTASVLGSCADLAGNTATANFQFQFDATAPTASITVPVNGATYGLNQAVTASYSCSDALSLVDTCTGTVPNGNLLDTSSTGSKTFSVTATDKAGNEATTSVTYYVTAFAGKQSVLSDLIALRNSPIVTGKGDAQKLDEAIDHLTKSLDPTLWSGGVPDSKHGEKVFSEEKDAVNKLVELIKDKKSNIPDATLLGFINRLVAADRALANDAILAAISAGGKADKITEAQKELAKGDALATPTPPQYTYSDAIGHYMNAWRHAQEALK